MLEKDHYVESFRRSVNSEEGLPEHERCRIHIASPQSLEDCNQILEQIIEGAAVIVNLQNQSPSKSTSILNYLCGGVYVLRGRAVRMADDVIVFMGEGTEI